MANKKKRKRMRQASARKQREEQKQVNDGSPKPGARWCTQTAQWINPEEDGDDLYDVACQIGEGKPIFTGMYRAPDDTALIELVCKMMGVSRESEFTVFDVFKTLPDGGGVLVVRESAEWPRGVSIIRAKGITVGGRGYGSQRPAGKVPESAVLPKHTATPKQEEKKTEPAKTTTVAAVVEAVLEKSIPRVPYTLKQLAV